MIGASRDVGGIAIFPNKDTIPANRFKNLKTVQLQDLSPNGAGARGPGLVRFQLTFRLFGGNPREKGFGINNMRPLGRLLICLIALSSLSAIAAQSQVVPTAVRIVDRVDDSQLVTLTGNTHPAANAKNDVGRVSSRLQMSDLIMVLSRSPERQAAFDAFVASQYDPSSPKFHQWLEPEEVGVQFGPSLADIATVSNWLSTHGFSVDEVSKDRMNIRFSGTAAQVESSFHVEIHNLTVNGEKHIGNMTDPQIPMALEPAVLGVKALHNFFPRPLHRLGGKVTLNRATGQWERVAAAPTGIGASGAAPSGVTPRPEFGVSVPKTSTTGAYVVEDLGPYDFATIYNVLPLWNASTPIDGTGQTIAIAGTSDINLADVTSFRTLFGLPAGTAPQIIHANAVDPGQCTGTTGACTIDDQIENALDVEWSGAVAKGASIVLVVSGPTTPSTDTVFTSANYAIQHNTAKILNVSYGECELFLGTAGNASYNTLWQTAASQGIAVFAAAGDQGSAACDGGSTPLTVLPAQYGLQVSGLASPQYVTAVGGTDFNWCTPTATTNCTTGSPYWGASNNSHGASALGYVPEVPWNDSCASPQSTAYLKSIATFVGATGVIATAEDACNFVANNYFAINGQYGVDLTSFTDVVGGGGGMSACTTSNGATSATCSGGYAKPSWQTGVSGIPTDGKRDIPDVSFFASNGIWNSSYLICVSADGACVTSTSTTTEPVAQEIGGTSASAPAMAGVMALINQKAGTSQGSPNAQLYALAGKQTYSGCKSETGTTTNGCYFNDIDSSTIAVPCGVGTPNCTVNTSGDLLGITSGYAATAGFDQASGLGSLNVANVVTGWSAITGTATATVTVTPASATLISNVSLTVTGTVTGSSGTATGKVTLTGGGYTSAATTLSGTGTYSIVIPANSLSAGADVLTVTYSGDSNYATATGTATVTVTTFVKATPTVTVTPASSTLNSGQTLDVTAKVTGTGGTPTGTVTLSSGTYTSSAQTLSSGSFTFTIPVNSLGAATDTLTVTYGGDSAFATATGTSTVTVTASVYTVATPPASTPPSVTRGSSASSTVTVSTSNNYSGKVTLSCSLTGSPTGAVQVPTCSAANASVTLSSGTTSGTANVTVSTTAATASMAKPKIGGWAEAGGGAVLALLMFFGIPARRRSWRAMLSVLALVAVLGSLAACGGGGGTSGGGGGSPGTTSGTYTFTVTGTGSPAVSPAPTAATFTLTVN